VVIQVRISIPSRPSNRDPYCRTERAYLPFSQGSPVTRDTCSRLLR
jgi:hypothetical protein